MTQDSTLHYLAPLPRRPRDTVSWLTQALCGGGMVAAAVLEIILICQNVRTVPFWSLSLFSALILLWRWGPYGTLAILSFAMGRHRPAALVVLAGAILITVPGEVLVYWVLLIHPDPQGVVALVSVPVMEFAGVVPVAIVAAVLLWFGRRVA